MTLSISAGPADTPLLHAVDAGEERRMRTGMRVKARWAAERIAGLIDAYLVRGLPFPAADRLARVQVWFSGDEGALSPAEYLDYRRGTTEVFSALGANTHSPGRPNIGT